MNKIAGVVALLSGTTHAFVRFGSCPSFEPMADFDTTRYMGRWYIGDALTPYQLFSECTTVNYDLIEGTDYVQVHNLNVYPVYGWNGMVGLAQESNEGGARFNVNFWELPDPEARSNYNVMDTDYESYALVYSCEEQFDGWLHQDYLWILSREPTMADTTLASVIDTIGGLFPRYDVLGESHKTYQGDWCQYQDMPITPDPQENNLFDTKERSEPVETIDP